MGYNTTNGTIVRKIEKLYNDNDLNLKELLLNNLLITKICPVCGESFSYNRSEREKTTCSHACSNTYFRSGKNNGSWKDDSYRTTCFLYHKKECVICGEKHIVAVHHYDNNHKNNNEENLIPMCPTHHQYMHSNHKDLIKETVDEYRNNFIKNKN